MPATALTLGTNLRNKSCPLIYFKTLVYARSCPFLLFLEIRRNNVSLLWEMVLCPLKSSAWPMAPYGNIQDWSAGSLFTWQCSAAETMGSDLLGTC